MIYHALTLGIAALVLTGSPFIAHAEEGENIGLYDAILKSTRQEKLVSDDAEEAVGQFIQKIYPEGESGQEAKPESQDEFFDALTGNIADICATGEQSLLGCISPVIVTQKYTERVMKVREFGRNLQRIAAGYEMPVHGYPGQPLLTGWMLPGLAELWQAGSNGVTNKRLRIEPVKLEDAGKDVAQMIQGLPQEERSAALWRYRHGVMNLEDPTQEEEEGDGGDLQHLIKRNTGLEDALRSLHEEVMEARGEDAPEIAEGEIVVFPAITLDDLSGVVWIRSDDIGVTPLFPIEPVLPALDCTGYSGDNPTCRDGAVLGGTYPPQPRPLDLEVPVVMEEIPEEGRDLHKNGLCSHPLAQRGYLCRPLDLQNCEEDEEGDPENPQLLLRRCRRPKLASGIPTKYSPIGPGICNPGGWREDPEGQEEIPQQCRTCQINLNCRAACPGRKLFSTEAKQQDGTIETCVEINAEEGIKIPMKLRAIGAATLAQLQCGSEVGQPNALTTEQCCANGYQSYKALCEAAGREGGFLRSTFSVSDCIEAFSPLFCQDRGVGVCIDNPTPKRLAFLAGRLKRITDHISLNMGKGEESCEVLQEEDPDLSRIFASLPHPCSPGCRSAYKNTIGNNLCFAGQCIEKSVQEHRLIPGRTPYVTYDSEAPFDICRDPAKDTTAAIAVPPERSTVIPRYRLQEFAQTLERALCQSTALPVMVPSILCNSDPQRRLDYQGDAVFTAIDIGAQEQERSNSMDVISQFAPSIASSVGTQLYLDYLGNTGLALGDLMSLANNLLQTIGDTEFPNAMCPRVWDSDVSLCEAIKDPDLEL